MFFFAICFNASIVYPLLGTAAGCEKDFMDFQNAHFVTPPARYELTLIPFFEYLSEESVNVLNSITNDVLVKSMRKILRSADIDITIKPVSMIQYLSISNHSISIRCETIGYLSAYCESSEKIQYIDIEQMIADTLSNRKYQLTLLRRLRNSGRYDLNKTKTIQFNQDSREGTTYDDSKYRGRVSNPIESKMIGTEGIIRKTGKNLRKEVGTTESQQEYSIVYLVIGIISSSFIFVVGVCIILLKTEKRENVKMTVVKKKRSRKKYKNSDNRTKPNQPLEKRRKRSRTKEIVPMEIKICGPLHITKKHKHVSHFSSDECSEVTNSVDTASLSSDENIPKGVNQMIDIEDVSSLGMGLTICSNDDTEQVTNKASPRVIGECDKQSSKIGKFYETETETETEKSKLSKKSKRAFVEQKFKNFKTSMDIAKINSRIRWTGYKGKKSRIETFHTIEKNDTSLSVIAKESLLNLSNDTPLSVKAKESLLNLKLCASIQFDEDTKGSPKTNSRARWTGDKERKNRIELHAIERNGSALSEKAHGSLLSQKLCTSILFDEDSQEVATISSRARWTGDTERKNRIEGFHAIEGKDSSALPNAAQSFHLVEALNCFACTNMRSNIFSL